MYDESFTISLCDTVVKTSVLFFAGLAAAGYGSPIIQCWAMG
jgi:hypothetical protein